MRVHAQRLLLALLVGLAAAAGLILSAAAQTGDGGADDADPQGRIIARVQDRTGDDGVDDYRVEFGFFPEWAMDDKDPWAEAITTWSDWLPRARYLTKTVIDRRDADDNRRWLRSSLISVPASASAHLSGGATGLEDDGASGQNLIEGRVIARYSPDSRGRLRVEFGFLPECAFTSTSNTEEAVEQYGEDLLPSARYLSASTIESRRGVWLRSSVVGVPSSCDDDTNETTITISSPRLSFGQREEVESQRIGTVEGPLMTGLDRVTTSGLPDGLTIAVVDASANVRRLVLSGTVDPAAEPQSYVVRITARPPEGDAVSAELTIRITTGNEPQVLTWSGYTPDTEQVSGRVTLRQPRVVTGPSSPEWSYAPDTSRICTVDRETGELRLIAVGQCLVTATSAAKEGFREESIPTEVTVTDKPVPEIRWRGYSPLEATVGETAPRFLPPIATVAGRSVRLAYTYEVDEDSERNGICDVNARNGTIDAMAAGTCVLIAKSAETDEYAAASSDSVRVTIIIEKQDPELRWDGYDDENLREGGDPIRPIRDPQPDLREARGELAYTYSATPSSICSVNSRTGELTPRREGSCDVTVRSEETDKFRADEVTVTVRVGPGPDRPDLDWFDYPDSPAVANGDAIMPSRPGSRDRVGPLSYRSQTPGICSVDSRTGLLSGRERGTCRVTVTSEETDDLFEGSETITVRIIPLPLPDPCELSYSRDVEVDGQTGPDIDCGDGDARARYETETPTICSVNRNSGDVTGLAEGQCRITVTVPATSRYAEATARATLTVNPPPPIECDDIADVGPLTPGESSRRIYLDDYCEGERLSYTATSSDNSVATVSISGDSLTVTAARDGDGAVTITVTATDPVRPTGRTSFRVTVDGNEPPESVGRISNVTLDVDDSETVDVSGNFRDADGDSLTYESDSDNSAVRVNTNGSRVTVEGRRAGSATITVTADDGNGGTATQRFDVTVIEPTDIRSISCSPTQIDVDENVTCTADVRGTEPITYSWSGGDSSGSGATYRTSFSSSGTKRVRLTASNSAGSDSDSATVIVRVDPSCSAAPDILTDTNDRGRTYTYDLDDYCQPGPFSYRASSDNTSVATVSVSGSTLTITIQGADIANVRFTGVTSDGRSASSEFSVAVNLARNRDIIADTSPHSEKVVVGASYAKTLSFGTYFHDPDGDEMTHTVASNSRSVRVSPSGSNFVVEGRSRGSATVTVTADDGRGSSAQTSFAVSALVYPSSGFARCGSDTIKVYYFQSPENWPLSKYHLDITGDEATTIFGASWWSTIGSLSGAECSDWSTGFAYNTTAARSLARELGLPR